MDSDVKAPSAAELADRPRPWWQLAIFGFPAAPHAFIAMPATMILPTFYAATTDVTLTEIAAFTTFARLLDALIDPGIGLLSDRTRTRIGARKPWIIAGTLLCCVAVLFLFQPPASADIFYYGLWSCALVIGLSLIEIPRSAWATELNRDYQQRSRIWAYISQFNIGGSLTFYIVSAALFLVTGTMAIGGDTLTTIAFLYVALMPIGVLLAVFLVDNGPKIEQQTTTLRGMLRSLTGSPPLWHYYGAIAFWALGQGAFLSVIYIFITDYMKLAEIFPVVMISYFALQILVIPVWVRIIKRIGKHRAWAIGLTFDALARPAILFFDPGSESLIPLFALAMVGAFFGTPANLCPTAMLGDVVDHDILKRGRNNAGNFFAFNTLIISGAMTFGTAVALFGLGYFDYRVGEANTSEAIFGLQIMYVGFPGLMHLGAAALGWFFPITPRRHDIIRRRIERRHALPTHG